MNFINYSSKFGIRSKYFVFILNRNDQSIEIWIWKLGLLIYYGWDVIKREYRPRRNNG